MTIKRTNLDHQIFTVRLKCKGVTPYIEENVQKDDMNSMYELWCAWIELIEEERKGPWKEDFSWYKSIKSKNKV
jgi:hypothetical protein